MEHLARFRTLLVCAALGALVLMVFSPLRHAQFLNYDDNIFVSENPELAHGFTRDSVRWALSAHLLVHSRHAEYWMPLTLFSRLADVQFHGLKPCGHHTTNILLHALNAILLFLALRQLSGAFWRSAFVAALFAVHPLNVEPVAWISARKDLVCGVFWMLTLLTYGWYARRPTVWRYLVMTGAFVCGLMSKPMLVTLPFLLLLLDWWPLQRFGDRSADRLHRLHVAGRLIAEKLPLIALALGAATLAFVAQRSLGVVASLERFPIGIRMGNALLAYADYIGQTVWPAGLTVFYPHPHAAIPWVRVSFTGAALAAACVYALLMRFRKPYLMVGWFSFLGVLVPVIGLVQNGMQARNDRYMYEPIVGLLIIAVWGAAEVRTTIAKRWPEFAAIGCRLSSRALAGTGCAVIAALAIVARLQTAHWQNSQTLFEHALVATSNNYVAHLNLGDTLWQEGEYATTLAHFREAYRIEPTESAPYLRKALYGIGLVASRAGDPAGAIERYRESLSMDPTDAAVHRALGVALAKTGNIPEAIEELREAARLAPDSAEVNYVLGFLLFEAGDTQGAAASLMRALTVKPDYEEARAKLAQVAALIKAAE